MRTTLHGLLETMLQPDYLAILRLIVAESPRFPELGDLFRHTVPEQGFRYFIALLRSGQRNGVVRQDIDPATVTRMLLGTLLTFVLPNGLIQSARPRLCPTRAALDACVDHVLELVSMRTEKVSQPMLDGIILPPGGGELSMCWAIAGPSRSVQKNPAEPLRCWKPRSRPGFRCASRMSTSSMKRRSTSWKESSAFRPRQAERDGKDRHLCVCAA